eukprot:6487330-Amphidinium_carterae.1
MASRWSAKPARCDALKSTVSKEIPDSAKVQFSKCMRGGGLLLQEYSYSARSCFALVVAYRQRRQPGIPRSHLSSVLPLVWVILLGFASEDAVTNTRLPQLSWAAGCHVGSRFWDNYIYLRRVTSWRVRCPGRGEGLQWCLFQRMR